MKTLIFCILLSLSISTCLSQQLIEDSIVSGGINRYFNVYIPASYNTTTAVPLVINMHGLGSNKTQQAAYGNFMPIADTANFIIVHPQGTYNTTLGANYWNAYFGGGVDDISFLSELIDSISANYNINPNRIHATGMSNGGFMSLALACGLNNKIASVASVTGTMSRVFPTSCPNYQPISILQIHGTNDGTVDYNGNGNGMSVDEVLTYWITKNNTATIPLKDSIINTNTTDGCYANRFTYGGGINSTEVVHYKVTNGGHTWPGSAYTIGVTNQDFNASKVIWDFFNTHQTVSILKNYKTLNNITVTNNIEDKNLILTTNNSNLNAIYSIVNLSGKTITEGNFDNKSTTISTLKLKSSMYIVRVVELNTGLSNSFKFIIP